VFRTKTHNVPYAEHGIRDIVWILHFAILKAQPGQARLPFALYVRNDDRAPRLIKLIAMCGPLDMDAPEPAITVMMPDEA